jgi:hypothetical protein
MKRRAILRRSVGGSLLLLACSASTHLHAAVATWGDELNNAPTVVRPDGNVWRDYPPGEAGGQLNAWSNSVLRRGSYRVAGRLARAASRETDRPATRGRCKTCPT